MNNCKVKIIRAQTDDWFAYVKIFWFVYFAPMCFDFSMNMYEMKPLCLIYLSSVVAKNKVWRTIEIMNLLSFILMISLVCKNNPLLCSQGCALIGNFASILIFIAKNNFAVGHALNFSINVFVTIEILAFLSFHRQGYCINISTSHFMHYLRLKNYQLFSKVPYRSLIK